MSCCGSVLHGSPVWRRTHTHKTYTHKHMHEHHVQNHFTQCWALSVMSMHTLPGDVYACMIAGRFACKTLLGMHSPCELNLSLDTAHMQCMVHKCHAHLATRAAILWATDCMCCSNGACTPFAVSETCTLLTAHLAPLSDVSVTSHSPPQRSKQLFHANDTNLLHQMDSAASLTRLQLLESKRRFSSLQWPLQLAGFF